MAASQGQISKWERAPPEERVLLEKLLCLVSPVSALIIAGTTIGLPNKKCVWEAALSDYTEDLVVEVVSIMFVKLALLRETNRLVSLTKYLEKLIMMQLLEASLGLVVGVLEPMGSKPGVVAGLWADFLCVVSGAWVLQRYFSWNNLNACLQHKDILLLVILVYVSVCGKWIWERDVSKDPTKKMSNPRIQILWTLTETGNWLEIFSFLGGSWDLIRPSFMGAEKVKPPSFYGNEQFLRHQAMHSWIWLLIFFVVDDFARPIWEGQQNLCIGRDVMVLHDVHFFMCVDFAVFYLYQMYMPQQEDSGIEIKEIEAQNEKST